MAALIWAVAGVLLLAGEALSGDFVLLMLGGGALIAALATVLGAPVWLAAMVFAAASFALIALVRPAIKRHLLRRPTIPSNVDALIGAPATALSGFGDSGGQVRIGGEVWSARPAHPGESFVAGEKLVISRIDGATAVVERGNN